MPPPQLPTCSSHKVVGERGRHRTAARVRADMLRPRARARPAKKHPTRSLPWKIRQAKMR